MVDFIKMLSYRKGDGCTYRPEIGQFCLISGPNCDDDNGYTYMEAEVLWKDDLFVVYRKPGCWPVVNKWEHIRAKPLEDPPMTAPSLLDELDEVVRLMDAASFVDLDWGWRRDDDDTPGSIFTHSFGGMHQAVAMCPRYGKDSFAADASYIVALHNFLRTHHAELADMAKRLEAAERDASPGRCKACGRATRVVCDGLDGNGLGCTNAPSIDIAATQEGEG